MIKNKTTYKETMSELYPRQKLIRKEMELNNYPPINKNQENATPNAWIARASRQDAIVKEQREKIDQLEVALKQFIELSNKIYQVPDLLTIDLKEIVRKLKIN